MMRFMALIAIVAIGGPSLAGQARGRATIGIVIDGDRHSFEQEDLDDLKGEIATLLERDFDVSFPAEKTLRSNYAVADIAANLDRLLADDEVDLVLCIGVLSTMEAASRGPFPKPVAAPFGIDSDMPVYPREGDASGVDNFNYLATPANLGRDARMLARLKPVDKVHMVVYEKFAELIPGLSEYVSELFAKHGMEVVYVSGDDRAQPVLDKLPDDAEMVYVAPMVRFSPEERVKLYEGLIRKRLPSFSLLGREEVEIGAMIGLAPRTDRLRWFRRTALNIQRIMLGENAGDLPVILQQSSELSINMATARAVGWHPSWDVQVEAVLIDEDPEDIDRTLTLGEAVREAIEVNLDLQAAERDIALAEKNLAQAMAQRRPQLGAQARGLQVDEDSAAASFGNQAETTVSGTLTLQQLLFSDEANAAVEIQRQTLEAQRSAFRTAQLDLAEQAAVRFLDYLKAKTLYDIQRNNLATTNEHLETAETRRDIGISGPADVYRWESQKASDQRDAIDAWSRVNSALAGLNQLLHFPQESLLRARIPDLTDPMLLSGMGRLQPYVDDEQSFQRFRGFMVAEGLKNAPELAQFDAVIAVAERQRVAAKRSFFAPTVSLQAQLVHDFDRSGETGRVDLPIPNFTFPEQEDTRWNVALSVSLPLFSGGARSARLGRAGIAVEQLRIQRQALAEKIELRIRTSLDRVAATSTAIQLTREAADAAHQNYELVQDSYAKGVASAIDLLDAQNAALTADQAASVAVYDFLQALMRLQRAYANFDFFTTPSQREDYFKRLAQFFDQFED